ncbi:MAG: hypothetical protein JSW52_10615 [Candidatus Coatesbacteria bacterium]|nr:MAG: hypothetical protein JSW52_10615 [Candidatus Coatesbacteria bacterium]
MAEENRVEDSLIEKILTVRNENLRRGADRFLGRFLVNWQRKQILSRHKVGIRIVNGDDEIAEYTVWSSDGRYWDKYKRDINEEEVWVIWSYDLSYIERVASECEEIIDKDIDDETRKDIRKVGGEETGNGINETP